MRQPKHSPQHSFEWGYTRTNPGNTHVDFDVTVRPPFVPEDGDSLAEYLYGEPGATIQLADLTEEYSRIKVSIPLGEGGLTAQVPIMETRFEKHVINPTRDPKVRSVRDAAREFHKAQEPNSPYHFGMGMFEVTYNAFKNGGWY